MTTGETANYVFTTGLVASRATCVVAIEKINT
ncbi:MAG: hypothetical protein ACJASX_004046 [Limisphaerales bacterium]|jgi:hypothetical protein